MLRNIIGSANLALKEFNCLLLSLLLSQFAAVEARFLRASFSAFVDILVLATRTIEQFGSN